MSIFSSATEKAVKISALLSVIIITGCAGRDFIRPDLNTIVVGKTTQSEVVSKLGKPYGTGSVEKNGLKLDTASYSYANTGSATQHPGVTGARTLGLYYKNSIVIGTEFTSSFKADGTDFDESKVAQLEKGKSTKEDAIRLFGPPGGDWVFPMTANPNEKAIVYLYHQTKGSAFNLRFYLKTLNIVYDDKGVITDITYSAQGNKD